MLRMRKLVETEGRATVSHFLSDHITTFGVDMGVLDSENEGELRVPELGEGINGVGAVVRAGQRGVAGAVGAKRTGVNIRGEVGYACGDSGVKLGSRLAPSETKGQRGYVL